jgi:hypothetical protein
MTDAGWLARIVRWTWRALRRHAPSSRRAGAAQRTATVSVGGVTVRVHSWPVQEGSAPPPSAGGLAESGGVRALARTADLGAIVGAHIVDATSDGLHHFVVAFRQEQLTRSIRGGTTR